MGQNRTLQSAELLVSDLNRVGEFYRDIVGLEQGKVGFSDPATGSHLLTLTFDPNARRPIPPRAGLFHLAFLYSNTASLAAAIRRALESGSRAHGFQDHGVSEAFYLSDPDGNGVELYVDRPEADWPRNGNEIAMGSDAIALDSWLLQAESSERADAIRLGHVHLRVSSLSESNQFYHEELGLDITQSSYPGALFMSYDGYHHHVAINTWSGEGIAPRQPDETGLVGFTIHNPAAGAADRRDPNGVSIRCVG